MPARAEFTAAGDAGQVRWQPAEVTSPPGSSDITPAGKAGQVILVTGTSGGSRPHPPVPQPWQARCPPARQKREFRRLECLSPTW